MGAGEIGDVSGGDVIAAGFTNDVKDRTAMRYASAASRDSIITAPVAGSLAYLEDVNRVTLYRNGAWGDMVSVDLSGNIDLGTDDFVTADPGSFRGPGAIRKRFSFNGNFLVQRQLCAGWGRRQRRRRVDRPRLGRHRQDHCQHHRTFKHCR